MGGARTASPTSAELISRDGGRGWQQLHCLSAGFRAVAQTFRPTFPLSPPVATISLSSRSRVLARCVPPALVSSFSAAGEALRRGLPYVPEPGHHSVLDPESHTTKSHTTRRPSPQRGRGPTRRNPDPRAAMSLTTLTTSSCLPVLTSATSNSNRISPHPPRRRARHRPPAPSWVEGAGRRGCFYCRSPEHRLPSSAAFDPLGLSDAERVAAWRPSPRLSALPNASAVSRLRRVERASSSSTGRAEGTCDGKIDPSHRGTARASPRHRGCRPPGTHRSWGPDPRNASHTRDGVLPTPDRPTHRGRAASVTHPDVPPSREPQNHRRRTLWPRQPYPPSRGRQAPPASGTGRPKRRPPRPGPLPSRAQTRSPSPTARTPQAPIFGIPDRRVTGVTNTTLTILELSALEVPLGHGPARPRRRRPQPALAAGFGFLYAHVISVSLAQHALVFEGLDRRIYPLLDSSPRYVRMYTLTKNICIHRRSRVLLPTTYIAADATAEAAVDAAAQPLLLGPQEADHTSLYIAAKLSTGMVRINSHSDEPILLPPGWPVAHVTR
ncbi:hypothetical protein ACSSS7_001494 [Eimeria intestinalis]